jgi:hypothetical protein
VKTLIIAVVAMAVTLCPEASAQSASGRSAMGPSSWAEGSIQVSGGPAVAPPVYHMASTDWVDQVMMPTSSPQKGKIGAADAASGLPYAARARLDEQSRYSRLATQSFASDGQPLERRRR